jgi:hypothetical protein
VVVFNRQAIDFYNDINSNIYRVRTVEINTAVVSENLLIGCEQSSGSQKIGIVGGWLSDFLAPSSSTRICV